MQFNKKMYYRCYSYLRLLPNIQKFFYASAIIFEFWLEEFANRVVSFAYYLKKCLENFSRAIGNDGNLIKQNLTNIEDAAERRNETFEALWGRALWCCRTWHFMNFFLELVHFFNIKIGIGRIACGKKFILVENDFLVSRKSQYTQTASSFEDKTLTKTEDKSLTPVIGLIGIGLNQCFR